MTRAMGAVRVPARLGKTYAVEQALTRVSDVAVGRDLRLPGEGFLEPPWPLSQSDTS